MEYVIHKQIFVILYDDLISNVRVGFLMFLVDIESKQYYEMDQSC